MAAISFVGMIERKDREMVGASTLPRNHGSVWGANNVRLEIPSAREKKPQSCRNDSLAFSEKDQPTAHFLPISSPSFPLL